MKRVDPTGIVIGTIPRDELVAVQTPQAFRADVLRAAHAGGSRRAPTTPRWSKRAGGRVVVVAGAADNFKITEPGRPGAGRRGPRAPGGRPMIRVGLGYDVHPFGTDGALVIGGVTVAGRARARRPLRRRRRRPRGGRRAARPHRPARPRHAVPRVGPGVRGRVVDRAARATSRAGVAHEGWWIGNVDVAIAAERPKLGPHTEAMAANVAAALDVAARADGARHPRRGPPEARRGPRLRGTSGGDRGLGGRAPRTRLTDVVRSGARAARRRSRRERERRAEGIGLGGRALERRLERRTSERSKAPVASSAWSGSSTPWPNAPSS